MAIDNAIDACRFWLQDEDGDLFDDDQVQMFLDLALVQDINGYNPGDSGYTSTYDVLTAAAHGWMWKAGQLKNQVITHRLGDESITIDKDFCLRQARILTGSFTQFMDRSDEISSGDISARFWCS